MKRGEITTVEKLIPGDRFCKRGSKEGKRYEFLEKAPGGKCKALPDGNKWIEEMRGGTIVIFLRNANDNH